MEPDPHRPPGPEGVTWEELKESAEASWRLTGPNSKGGTRLYRYKGQLFTVGYGECSSLPGGAEQILGARPDNTPGFPPLIGLGHAAGCAHEPDHDWWMHVTCLLRLDRGGVQLFEGGRELWSCPLPAFLRASSTQRADVLRRMGPVVLDELLQCAARWLPTPEEPASRRRTRPRSPQAFSRRRTGGRPSG